MGVLDTSYLLWPRKKPFTRATHDVWRPSAVAVAGPELADRVDPIRRLTFYAGLLLLLVKFAMLPELLSLLFGFNTYVLYIVGIPAAVGIIVSGGVRRTVAGLPAWVWISFACWMVLCVPFSSWKAGSLDLVKVFVRDDILLMLAVAGLMVSWRDCQLMIRAIACAAAVSVLSGRLFATEEAGRLSLSFSGVLGNSNDFAAHLILTLPFVLVFVYNSRSKLVRLGAALVVGYGLLMIVKTASRGALIALIVCAIFAFLAGSALQRMALLMLAPLVLLAVLLLVPSTTLQRIRSFSSSEQDVSQEALESTDARRYVLQKGIEYTLEFPIFGVGPGQFSSYEGKHNKVFGEHGMWHQTHNAWVQASSECGIPGGLLLLGGYISSFWILFRTWREASRRSDCRDIRNAVFCVLMGMSGFMVAITFLNFAYYFHGPALAGMAMVLRRAARYEFAHRGRGERQKLQGFGPTHQMVRQFRPPAMA
ncbi:MAG TPA: O-antigen ligase family protein [Bryobacteraceae bacterium]|nr:O-antigen ligase family protein [Bryobacteraceae bacterium]